MVQTVFQLKCSCNEYPWGKQGKESLSARLAEKTPGTDFKLDPNKPYAEMYGPVYIAFTTVS
jgi:mannose-6-phosphate isomerase